MLFGDSASGLSFITAGYVCNAVHFDGSKQGGGPTALDCASLSCSDTNGYFSMSIWSRGFMDPLNYQAGLWVTSPTWNYEPEMSNSGSGFEFVYDTPSVTSFSGHWTGLDYSNFNHWLFSVDTNQSQGNKIMLMYINDTLVAPTTNSDLGPASTTSLFNGNRFIFGDIDGYAYGPTMDVADVWIAPGVKLHDGTNTIPEATRRQFISETGRPVDPVNFPAGGSILFSSNGTPSSFATNQLGGGSFSLVGSLTSAGVV